MHISNHRLVLLVMVFILFVSLAIAQDGSTLRFGSKVQMHDADESKAPFMMETPEGCSSRKILFTYI